MGAVVDVVVDDVVLVDEGTVATGGTDVGATVVCAEAVVVVECSVEVGGFVVDELFGCVVLETLDVELGCGFVANTMEPANASATMTVRAHEPHAGI